MPSWRTLGLTRSSVRFGLSCSLTCGLGMSDASLACEGTERGGVLVCGEDGCVLIISDCGTLSNVV